MSLPVPTTFVRATVGATVLAGLALAASALTAAPASAGERSDARAGVVFVQNGALDGNVVTAYDRGRGRVAAAGRQLRHRRQWRALQGAAVDFTASQGALVRRPLPPRTDRRQRGQ